MSREPRWEDILGEKAHCRYCGEWINPYSRWVIVVGIHEGKGWIDVAHNDSQMPCYTWSLKSKVTDS